MPLMRGADERAILASAELIRRQPGMEELETVLSLFASFVLEPEQVKRLMRWDMAVLRESPWYREIVEEGRRVGLEEGRRTGLEEGRRASQRKNLLALLAWRFGAPPAMLGTRLEALDLPTLESLFDAALDAESLAAFEAQLVAVQAARG